MGPIAFTQETAFVKCEGLIHLDGEHLLVEYQRSFGGIAGEVLSFGLPLDGLIKTSVKQVRVPRAALSSVTFEVGYDLTPCKIVLQAAEMAAVQELPGMSLGRVELAVAWEDREAAAAFVASLQSPNPVAG